MFQIITTWCYPIKLIRCHVYNQNQIQDQESLFCILLICKNLPSLLTQLTFHFIGCQEYLNVFLSLQSRISRWKHLNYFLFIFQIAVWCCCELSAQSGGDNSYSQSKQSGTEKLHRGWTGYMMAFTWVLQMFSASLNLIPVFISFKSAYSFIDRAIL